MTEIKTTETRPSTFSTRLVEPADKIGGLMTAAGVSVSELYPDLFDGVDEAVRRRVVSNFGSDAHEGWEPNRPDVELVVGYATGRISEAEYMRVAFAEVEDSRQHIHAAG